jgi:hypothetical protein
MLCASVTISLEYVDNNNMLLVKVKCVYNFVQTILDSELGIVIKYMMQIMVVD